LFLARRKKRRQRREKDFLHIILTFSRSCLFLWFSLSPCVSLLALYEEKQINRFILQIPSSFFFGAAHELSYETPRSHSLHSAASPWYSWSLGRNKRKAANITCRTRIAKRTHDIELEIHVEYFFSNQGEKEFNVSLFFRRFEGNLFYRYL
jgi:hypothetical protein